MIKLKEINMAHEFKQEKEPLIYFLCDVENINCKKIYKKDIVYVGETRVGFSRLFQHTAKKHNKTMYIRRESFKNKYFRKYYEARLIKKFNPKYNQKINTPPSLNLFLLKVFLWFENPNPQWLILLSKHSPFMERANSKGIYWLSHIYAHLPVKNRERWVVNGYTRVWETLDLNKKLYIDNQNPFKFLINEEMKPSLTGSLRKEFTPRKEKIHN